MIGLVSLRAEGFHIRLLDNDAIGVSPVSQLSDEQRLWVEKNTFVIRDQLRTEQYRWAGFLSLAQRFGITADQVKAEFSHADIADLVLPEHSDPVLFSCMATLAASIKRKARATPTSFTARSCSTEKPRYRCGRCVHFRFNPTEPVSGMGWCGVRNDLPMAVPNRRLECDVYLQRQTPETSINKNKGIIV